MLIGIIGTAGRRDDGPRLNAQIYTAAYFHVLQLISELPRTERNLVSGGAAWMDHLAVMLFNAQQANSLKLYFPCAWEPKHQRFADTGVFDWRTNPGGTSNHFHRKFSAKCGGSSLAGIQQALDGGAQSEVVFGFKARNRPVGRVDWLIALTFGDDEVPKDGGTRDTWDHSSAPRKTHLPLAAFEQRS